MNRLGIPADWTEHIASVARRTAGVEEVWAFGSRVRGNYEPNSDLDLAVIVAGDDEAEIQLQWMHHIGPRLRRELDSLLPVDVDIQLANEGFGSSRVRPGIASSGILIFCRS